ncbi:MAG: hypothetical protein KDB06_10795 [Ilumatobacter sp.]|nr:hypothetical protein [Ilumatobacter sp.]MCB0985122.1 hypothetical protein [Ilumatobacter sp.]
MPRRRRAALLAVCLVPLVGCAVGKRPYFNDEPYGAGNLTGDTAVDAVLSKLDAGVTGPITAVYNGQVKFGQTDFQAIVELDGANRVVTLGSAVFRDTAAGQQTCSTDESRPCEDGLLAQRASDTTLSIDFYGADMAVRIRRKAAAIVGPATAHNETFAQQPATCVDLPLSDGINQFIAVYCVMDNGMVAMVDDSDVLIELTMFAPSVDDAAFDLG